MVAISPSRTVSASWPVGQVHQHRVAGGAFDEGGDRGLVGLAHDQVAFPMSWHGAVFDFGRPVADHDHRVDEAVGALIGGPVRFAAGPAGAKCLGTSRFSPPRAWKYRAW